MSFRTDPFGQKIEKPWGYEIIFTQPWFSHVGKIMFVKAGQRLSFQYHDQKEETLCLVDGKALIWLENAAGDIEKVPMENRKGYTIALMQKHRVEALEDSLLIEASDPEKGNTFRITDDYARGTETEELRGTENRGWTQP